MPMQGDMVESGANRTVLVGDSCRYERAYCGDIDAENVFVHHVGVACDVFEASYMAGLIVNCDEVTVTCVTENSSANRLEVVVIACCKLFGWRDDNIAVVQAALEVSLIHGSLCVDTRQERSPKSREKN